MRLPDLIQTGIRQEDLVEPGGPPLPTHVEVMTRTTNLAIRSMASALTRGLNFSDNHQCTVVTAKFTHGVATSLNTGGLTQCNGLLVLNEDKGQVVFAKHLQGSSTAGQVKATLWFLDSSATNINITAVLLPEGIISQLSPSIAQTWQTPTFQNSWVDFGNVPVGYMKDALGFVHLRGDIKTGTIGQAAFTLPVGYRPSAFMDFAVASNGAYGQCNIAATGTVTPITGTNVAFGLNGITFDTR